ncbi:MAG: class I SAM-dependent methyltransferase [Alphaproteobacteria bacterium]
MPNTTIERQQALIWEYLKGFHATHLIGMGTQMGLWAELADAKSGTSAVALAEKLNLHAPYVEIWCRTAFAYRLIEATADGRYVMAPHMREVLVDRSDPRHLGTYVATTVNHTTDDLRAYPEYFKTGGVKPFQVRGDDFTRHISDATAGFHSVVAKKLLPSAPGLKEKFAGGARVLDIGCGTAGLLIKLAQAWPKVTGVGVDIDPYGIAQARANIAAAGVAKRIDVEAIGGEGMKYASEFDAATMFEVLHEIAPDRRESTVAAIHRALAPGGVLFIIDETYPSGFAELRDAAFAFAVQTQFNELAWGNIVPTREEQDRLFAGAGFAHVQRTLIAGLFTMITAIKT